jgi:hypothetical protein
VFTTALPVVVVPAGVVVVVAEVVVSVVVLLARPALVVVAVVVVGVVVVGVVAGAPELVDAVEVSVGAQVTAVSESPAFASVSSADLLHFMW